MLFSTHLKQYKFEVWRLDSYCENKYYEKTIDGLKFRVFKSVRVPKLGHFSYKYIKELKKEYKATDPLLFIVHTHNWQTYQIAFFLKHSKIITTHHGDWSPFYVFKNTLGFRKLRALLGIIAEKLVMKNINHFLICDFKQIEYIKKAVKIFNYSIFSIGLNVDSFKPISRKSAREMLGWEDDKKYILYVGKLYKYKQVDELLKIWAEIRKNRPNVELVLVGNEPKGIWGEEYHDMAVEYGAKVIGRVLNTELYKYYCAADVYVLLGLRDDYFGGPGIAPLESLACNTPVVSNTMKDYLGNNADEICEVPDNLEGYKNAILKVIDHKDKYKNMRETVEKYYSLEAIVRQAEKIFIEVLKSNDEK